MTMHPHSLLTLLLLVGGPALAEEHIIDDQDGAPGFVTTGDDWTTWGTNGYGYDSSDTSYHYLSHTVGGSDRRGTATWQAPLGQAGIWQIDTWFRRTENRTHDANHVITDGHGTESWVVIDQEGEGASGWVSLGEYWCEEGFGGCVVTLDGTDDDDSDAANAMRFTLVATTPEPAESDPCDETPAPGTHEIEFFAGSTSSTGWESTTNATGSPDGNEAYSPNVDDGEVLRATDFDACDPDGDEIIQSVLLAVNARTQYEDGLYALDLLLDAGGSSGVFTGTSSEWHEVNITEDQDWTWSKLATLQAQVSLYDHPGGRRDSDAWVDSFSLKVVYTTLEPPEESGHEPEEPGEPEESEESAESDDPRTGGEAEELPLSDTGSSEGINNHRPFVSGCSCGLDKQESRDSASEVGRLSTAWLGLCVFGIGRRRSLGASARCAALSNAHSSPTSVTK